MIRTRDFVLFVVAAIFLVVAIVATAISRAPSSSAPSPYVFDSSESPLSADAPAEEIDRAAEIARLQAKIADMKDQGIASGYQESELPAEEELPPEPSGGAITLCGDYAPAVVGVWPASDIHTAERGGMRVVYTASTEMQPVTSGSSTSMQAVEVEHVLLQLPVRTQALPYSSCIKTDVVGVALDGSLIRNSDYTLYRIFGPETLIGYALDGLPIYGTAKDVPTDECGGTTIGEGYRYYLNPNREGVLGCYAAAPVSL